MSLNERGHLISDAWIRRRPPFKTRHKRMLIALSVVFVVVSCGLFVLFDPFRTSFHYEVSMQDAGSSGFSIWFSDLDNTNVTVLLTNETDKVLSVDIELFNRSSGFEIDYVAGQHFWISGSGQMKSLTAVVYSPIVDLLGVEGSNLTTTVRCDRSATFIELGPEYAADLQVCVRHTGTCTFVLDECVGLSDAFVEVELGMAFSVSHQPRTVFVYLDLPPDAEGSLYVDQDETVFHSLDGWYYRGGGEYSTRLGPPMNLAIYCNADMTHAWLYD